MILAGGHSLLPAMAIRGQRSGHLVDIGRIEALKGLALDEGGATIGAGVTLSRLLASPLAQAYPAIAEALGHVGNHVVRNRSTVGGCLGWADPRGELLLILIAHDAIITTSRRDIAAEAFAVGPFATMLAPGEAILSVRVPPPPPVAFAEIIARNSTGRALLSAACSLSGGEAVRLSVGGMVDRPLRSDAIMIAELDRGMADFLDGALARLPALADASSITYRRMVAPRLLQRCLDRLRP
jgi:CO/xanthine dehydrogenase FAD-binding subunit